MVALLLATPHAAAQLDEYAAKAGVIYNLSRFVTWPELHGEIRICVLGQDPFGAQLGRYAGRTVGSNRIAVAPLASIRQADRCQILFVAGDRHHEVPAIAASLEGIPTLIVSDTRETFGKGVMVMIAVEGGRIQFYVDNTAARRNGLAINAQVLALAKSVR